MGAGTAEKSQSKGKPGEVPVELPGVGPPPR